MKANSAWYAAYISGRSTGALRRRHPTLTLYTEDARL
jgi:hypothetical protein